MPKPFLNIDEQIDLLLFRGMTINKKEIARDYLLTNNYYNVINMYAKFFLVHPLMESFHLGTNFEEIITFHNFENEFRQVLLKYILLVESTFKSIVSHVFSDFHRDDYDYLNTTCFDQANIFDITFTHARIVRFIQRARQEKNNMITHYDKVHHTIPLWVLVNVFDFGTIENFYRNMNLSERNLVAKFFSLRLQAHTHLKSFVTANDLSSFLASIRDLRNVLAHGNKLIHFKSKKNICYFPHIHDIYGIASNAPKQDVYNIILIMRVFLTLHEYTKLLNTLRDCIGILRSELKTVSIDFVLHAYGFPHGWRSLFSNVNLDQ